jgi:membrane protein implicated in regulation of membrane protease activity
MVVKIVATFAAAALLAASPAFAHHGWSGQEGKLVDMTGTVVQGVSLAGPHGTMKIKVKDEVWDITLAPPARTSRAGLTEGIIPIGATVTVRGNRSTEAGHHEMKTVLVKHGAKEYHVYPDRE